MECAAKKVSFASDSSETLEIILYGFCEKFYPLANKKYVENIIDDLVSKHYQNKRPNVNIISHSNMRCGYAHPVESWEACDFEGDFKRHCFDTCRKISDQGHVVALPFNNVRASGGSEKVLSIVSETYLKAENAIKHISGLETRDCDVLYGSLSSAYSKYITLSYNFSPVKLELTPKSKIFVIPSILEVEGPTNKNVYTHRERFRQTLRQVKSIKDKVEDAVVIVCELAFMSLSEIYKISKYTSALVFFNKDATAVRYAKDPNKNKAEVHLQRFILTCLGGQPFSHFCKFGGRYSLSPAFDASKFFSDRPSFRIIPKAHDGSPIVESIFYSVPATHRGLFAEILVSMQEILDKNFTDVEHLLYNLFINKHKTAVNRMETLGVSGHFAGSGAYNPS